MEMCRIEGWGTRQLEERIDSMLYERTAISRKPDELIQLELDKLEQTNAVSEDMLPRKLRQRLLQLPPQNLIPLPIKPL